MLLKAKKEYILTPDKDGFLTSVKIITKVDDPEKIYSKIEEGKGKAKWAITIEADKTIFDDLKSDFQYLEASLAFVGNLRKIYWEEAKQEWVPETEEEKSRLKVISASFSRKHLDSHTLLTKNDIVQIVKGKSKYDCLTTLKSFYREGKNFHVQFQYVNAFYNFYFIIEDLFGGGKTKNKQIEESYQSSEELKETIKWAMDRHIKTSEKHYKGISKFLGEFNLSDTTEDIIRLLVRLRGRVHHYTSKSSVKLATPLSQRDFESISFLTMAIALMSILKEIVKINRRGGQKEISSP